MFWWLIWVFVFLILMANERHSWGGIFSDDTTSWGNRSSSVVRRIKDDWELKRQYKKNLIPEVVVVKADDAIEEPDFRLDKLIREGRLDEARKHRLEMDQISEENNDDAGMRKYAIYGARISRRKKELEIKNKRKVYRAEQAKKREISVNAIDTKDTGGEFHKTGVRAKDKSILPPLWGMKKKPVVGKSLEEEPHVDIPEPVIEKAETEKPVMPPVPEGFTPPPPGPVELGKLDGYKTGPVKPTEVEEPGKHPGEDEKIDPEDYTDLISL